MEMNSDILLILKYLGPVALLILGWVFGSGMFRKDDSASKTLKDTESERIKDKETYDKEDANAKAAFDFLEKQSKKEEEKVETLKEGIEKLEENITTVENTESKTEEEIKADYEKHGFKVEDF